MSDLLIFVSCIVVAVSCGVAILVRWRNDRQNRAKAATRRRARLDAMVAKTRLTTDAAFPHQTIGMGAFEARFNADEQELAEILTNLAVDNAVEQ